MVYPYSEILFIKRNEVLTHAAKWTNIENIMLSEISQTPKDKYCVTHMSCLEQANLRGENRIVVTRGSGRG